VLSLEMDEAPWTLPPLGGRSGPVAGVSFAGCCFPGRGRSVKIKK